MQGLVEQFHRRTATDVVFDELHAEIVSLTLLPGTKLSEVEIARRFGVSRQPVRDAFNRLENLDLLLIRPQKATEVRGFSMHRIAQARFVRLAVELEVIRHACEAWDSDDTRALNLNLEQQRQSVEENQAEKFHTLDYQFHKLICDRSGCPGAFDMIQACKQKVDRLCMLSLVKDTEFVSLVDDHQQIANALESQSTDDAFAVVRQHLSRLDKTISEIHESHSEYFE